jgi:threonine/homoserine efflux transporter RhtA
VTQWLAIVAIVAASVGTILTTPPEKTPEVAP